MIYQFGEHELDLDVHEVRHGGAAVPVEPQVFDVLAHLVEHRARTVTKEELLDAVWGDRFVSASALTSRIKAARRAVGDDGRRQDVIRTVHGRGYRFVAPVVERPGDPGDGGAPRDRRPGAASRPPRTRYATSGGHSVAYQVLDDRPPGGRGDGGESLPIVFVPGFVSNVELHWELPAFADTFRQLGRGRLLVLFDKRGTGVSERVPLDRLPTLEERVDDVRAVMDAAGVERAALVGISEGGPLALLFAATQPDRVDRLALFGTYDHHPLDRIDELVDRTRRYWGSGTAFELLAPSWAGDSETRRALGRFERLSATPEAAAAIVAMANEIDIRSVLPTIGQPTLILHRTGDAVFPVRGARALADGIPGARLLELEGSDHLLFADPEPALEAIDEFLSASPPPRPPSRTTVLTTLVAIVGPAGAAVDGAWLRDALADAGAAPSVDAAAPTPVDGATVLRVDGPARAVRAARRLVDTGPGGGWRAGVHTAEVDLVDGRPAGPGLAICVAVATAAADGEVLVTRTVTDLVAGSGLGFAPREDLEVAGLPGRWQLLAPTGSTA